MNGPSKEENVPGATTVAAFLRTHEAPAPADVLLHLSQLFEACANSQYKLSAKGYRRATRVAFRDTVIIFGA
jgi:hypothetical protein